MAPLLAIFFVCHQLPEIPFTFGAVLVFAVLIALLDNVQDSLNGTTTDSILPNLELAGQSIKELGAQRAPLDFHTL